MEKNKDFDQFIKKKLEEIQPGIEQDSWALFEQELDASEAGRPTTEDQAFDQFIFSKLHQMEADYQPGNWKIMAARLDEEFSFARKLIRYKVMELSLLLLLFLTIFQLLPFFNTQDNKSQITIPATQTTPQVEQDKSNIIDQVPLQTSPEVDPAAKEARPQASLDAESATTPNLANANIQEDQGRKTQSQPSAPYAIADPQLEDDSQHSLFRPSDRLTAAPLPLINSTINRKREDPLLLKLIQSTKDGNSLSTQRSPLTMASFSPLASTLFQPLEYHRSLGLSKDDIKPLNQPHLRFGTAGSVNYDRIITPPTTIEGDSSISDDRYAIGYGGGFTIGFEWKRWEIETGMIYMAKKYKPLPIVYLSGNFSQGYYGEGFKSIELNVINIPLHFRYNFLLQNRWRLYALAGGSLQFVSQANYYKADQSSFNFPAPLAPPSGGGRNTTSIDDKKVEDGILEGGSLGDNSYLSANLGLGIERYMSERWSIFAQPTYQHSLYYFNKEGLGPYTDRFHTMSILMGIKIKL